MGSIAQACCSEREPEKKQKIGEHDVLKDRMRKMRRRQKQAPLITPNERKQIKFLTNEGLRTVKSFKSDVFSRQISSGGRAETVATSNYQYMTPTNFKYNFLSISLEGSQEDVLSKSSVSHNKGLITSVRTQTNDEIPVLDKNHQLMMEQDLEVPSIEQINDSQIDLDRTMRECKDKDNLLVIDQIEEQIRGSNIQSDNILLSFIDSSDQSIEQLSFKEGIPQQWPQIDKNSSKIHNQKKNKFIFDHDICQTELSEKEKSGSDTEHFDIEDKEGDDKEEQRDLTPTSIIDDANSINFAQIPIDNEVVAMTFVEEAGRDEAVQDPSLKQISERNEESEQTSRRDQASGLDNRYQNTILLMHQQTSGKHGQYASM